MRTQDVLLHSLEFLVAHSLAMIDAAHWVVGLLVQTSQYRLGMRMAFKLILFLRLFLSPHLYFLSISTPASAHSL